MASKAEEIDVDGVAVRFTNRDKPYFPKLGSKGHQGRAVRLLPVRRRPDGEPAAGQAGSPAAVSRRHRGRGDLPEAGAAEAPRLSGNLSHHLSVGPHGRRAEGDASVGDRVGRADGHRHPAPVAGALPGHRASRRAAHRLRPAAGHRVRRGADHRRRRAQAAARRTRHGRLSEDLRRPGVHVFLRIATDWDFIEVRRAGIALAREIERRAPDAVTTSWWKEERGERVFIDYNQNARDRTFASAYSARKTPIATVSTPLTWAELADADPDDYTIETVPDFLARPRRPVGRHRRECAVAATAAGHGQSRRGAGPRRSAVSAELPEDAGRTTPRATQ